MNSEHIGLQLLLRSWPFPYGSGRLLDTFFHDLAFKAERAVVATTDGFSMTVMPNDWIGRHLYLTGQFDRATAAVLIKNSRPGDVLIDVGANIGYVSACFLAKVPGSRAICVEPIPLTFDLLSENMKQFGDRVQLNKVALSDRAGTRSMACDIRWLGASRLTDGGSVLVDIKQSATFFLELERADLVKIDVEGHEIEVLQGLSAHLSRLRPRAIFFEHKGDGALPDGRISRLLPGYAIFGVQKRLTHVHLIKPCGRFNDYLAMRLA